LPGGTEEKQTPKEISQDPPGWPSTLDLCQYKGPLSTWSWCLVPFPSFLISKWQATPHKLFYD